MSTYIPFFPDKVGGLRSLKLKSESISNDTICNCKQGTMLWKKGSNVGNAKSLYHYRYTHLPKRIAARSCSTFCSRALPPAILFHFEQHDQVIYLHLGLDFLERTSLFCSSICFVPPRLDLPLGSRGTILALFPAIAAYYHLMTS